MDRRQFRKMVTDAFASHDVPKIDGKWRVEHAEFSWVVELAVNGRGPDSPFSLFLQVWMPSLATDMQMLELRLRPHQVSEVHSDLGLPDEFSFSTPFPDDVRTEAVTVLIGGVAHYLRSVNSTEALRKRYAEGDFRSAFVFVKMTELMTSAS